MLVVCDGLTGRTPTRDWRNTVSARITAIEEQVDRLTTARSYLRHLIECQHEGTLSECPRFRQRLRPLPPLDEARTRVEAGW